MSAVPSLALDAVKTHDAFDKAFTLLRPPTTADRVQQGVEGLGDALQLLQEQLALLSRSLGLQTSQAVAGMTAALTEASVVQGKLSSLVRRQDRAPRTRRVSRWRHLP